MIKLEKSWVVIETSVSNYSFDINDLKKCFWQKKIVIDQSPYLK